MGLNLYVVPNLGYLASARIFSNSWGSMSVVYTYLDTEFDEFMANYRDALIFVAAGQSDATANAYLEFDPFLKRANNTG
jgi:hypothetical protein